MIIFHAFFFNDTATTEIYTLSLHDALPICDPERPGGGEHHCRWHWLGPAARQPCAAHYPADGLCGADGGPADRKSTRLNSSHANISYAVFCLKKKTKNYIYY